MAECKAKLAEAEAKVALARNR
nr:hypothetical protein [Synechococcus sp. MVIR-18-1]